MTDTPTFPHPREGDDTVTVHDMKFWFDTLAWVRERQPDSWWTVRDPDEWAVEPGDKLRILNEKAEEVGYATVGSVGHFTVASWCMFDPEGHRSYRTAGGLVNTMSEAYPEKDWTVDSEVVGIKMDPYTLNDHPSKWDYAAPESITEDRPER